VKFVLELAAFAALGYWGANAAGGAPGVVLAIAAPAIAIALWALFAAPRSDRRLPLATRVPLELAVFAVAALALAAADAPTAAIVFAAVALVNAALLSVWRQWEE
jgi:Protein of unknown function (DUF2568)